MTQTATQPTVLTRLLPTESGHNIGVLTLNAPQAMNAIDLEMVKAIDECLKQWQNDNSVVAVFMHGAGDRAFSAGGDIRKLYDSMLASGDEHLAYGDDFFVTEYRHDYRIHYFNKPLISWGNGFVMGGGLGIFVSTNHRIGTETLKISWPEIRIGLFPDVTGTWWLSRLPKPIGHWMALSGCHMTAVDCKDLGIVDYCLQHSQQDATITLLQQLDWTKNLAENHALVRRALQGVENMDAMPASELATANQVLARLFKSYELEAIDKAFKAYKGPNQWIQQGIKNFQQGCPATAHVIMRQLAQGADMSLIEALRWELDMAYQALRHPDFAEGVRALVVDKDFQPRWQHKSIKDVPAAWVDELCRSPWAPNQHPLKSIELY